MDYYRLICILVSVIFSIGMRRSVALLFFVYYSIRLCLLLFFFFFNDTSTTEFYPYLHTLSLHYALPISLDVMKLCLELGTLYIATVLEPWLGFHFDVGADPAKRTNYALRESVRREKARNPGGPTAVSCCGANPGMVSWFVKRSEEHTSELQSLMRISYAVFCLKKK